MLDQSYWNKFHLAMVDNHCFINCWIQTSIEDLYLLSVVDSELVCDVFASFWCHNCTCVV